MLSTRLDGCDSYLLYVSLPHSLLHFVSIHFFFVNSSFLPTNLLFAFIFLRFLMFFFRLFVLTPAYLADLKGFLHNTKSPLHQNKPDINDMLIFFSLVFGKHFLWNQLR